MLSDAPDRISPRRFSGRTRQPAQSLSHFRCKTRTQPPEPDFGTGPCITFQAARMAWLKVPEILHPRCLLLRSAESTISLTRERRTETATTEALALQLAINLTATYSRSTQSQWT